jgi:hypothetical protein
MRKPDASRLRFDSSDDALDFARKCVEDGNRRFASQRFDLVKRYRELDLDIVVQLHDGVSHQNHDLISRAVPSGGGKLHVAGVSHIEVLDVHSGPTERDWHQLGVLAAGDLVQCPEGAIPSLVWLERPRKRRDLLRDILASAHRARFVGRVTCEGKVRRLEGSATCRNGRGVHGLVKCVPKVLSDLSHHDPPVGEFRWELDLQDVMSGLRVALNRYGASVLLKECASVPLKITNVLLCAPQAPLGTIKGVGHGSPHENDT